MTQSRLLYSHTEIFFLKKCSLERKKTTLMTKTGLLSLTLNEENTNCCDRICFCAQQ